jgi:hypothetical protein
MIISHAIMVRHPYMTGRMKITHYGLPKGNDGVF